MPRYTIKDSLTGKSMVVEGDSPPTEDESTQLFSQFIKPEEFGTMNTLSTGGTVRPGVEENMGGRFLQAIGEAGGATGEMLAKAPGGALAWVVKLIDSGKMTEANAAMKSMMDGGVVQPGPEAEAILKTLGAPMEAGKWAFREGVRVPTEYWTGMNATDNPEASAAMDAAEEIVGGFAIPGMVGKGLGKVAGKTRNIAENIRVNRALAEFDKQRAAVPKQENLPVSLNLNKDQPIPPKMGMTMLEALNKQKEAVVNSKFMPEEMKARQVAMFDRMIEKQIEFRRNAEDASITSRIAADRERIFPPEAEAARNMKMPVKKGIDEKPVAKETTPVTLRSNLAGATDMIARGRDTLYKTLGDKVAEHPKLKQTLDSLWDFFSQGHTLKMSNEWQYARQEKAKGIPAQGESFAKRFVEKYNYLTPEQREIVWEVMNDTQVPSIPSNTGNFGQISNQPKYKYTDLPTDLRIVVDRFRSLDNQLGRMLVRNKIINEKTFLENKNKHIKYLYEMYLKENKSHGLGIDKAAYKRREWMTEMERDAMGLVKDPVLALGKSIIEASRSVGAAKYFGEVSLNPNWIFEPSVIKVRTPWGTETKMGIGKAKELIKQMDEVERATGTLGSGQPAYREALKTAVSKAEQSMGGKKFDNYIQLNGNKYGALDGVYVAKDIANDILPMWIVKREDASKFLSAARQITATSNMYWKMKNVALNAPTAFRNFAFSNPIQMNMSGTPLHKVFPALVDGIKEVRAKGNLYKQAERQGLFKTNFSESELNEIMAIAGKDSGKTISSLLEKSYELGSYYGKIDDLWKMAKFVEQMKMGVGAREAARLANHWVMDYSLVHPLVKEVRNVPLGAPYITYTYKVFPLILESLKRNPLVVGKYMLAPYVLQEMLTSDMSDKEAKKMIDSLPDYVKDGQVFLIPDKKGMQALDVSYMLPWGNWWKMGVHGVLDRDAVAVARDLGIGSGLLPSVAYAMATGKDLFTGEPIVSEIGKYDNVQGLKDRLKYIWKLSQPSMLTEYGPFAKIYEHEKYGKTKQGLPTTDYVYARPFGVNVYPLNPKGKQISMHQDIQAVRKEISKKIIQANKQGDQAEAKKLREIYKQVINLIQQEYRPQKEEVSPVREKEEDEEGT